MKLTHRHAHWTAHIVLALAVIALCVTSFGAGVVVGRHDTTGAMSPRGQVLPTPQRGGGASVLPKHFSLAKYVVRIHDQGDSESCGCQSLSEALEIMWHEHTDLAIPLSAGFVCRYAHLYEYGYDADNPLSVAAVAYAGEHSGDSKLSLFPADGTPGSFGAIPSAAALRDASRRLISGDNSVTSRADVESDISRGYPVMLLMPAYFSLNSYAGGYLNGQSDGLNGWHYTLIVGYNSSGVLVQNSWGAGWGLGGFFHVSWSYLFHMMDPYGTPDALFVAWPSFSISHTVNKPAASEPRANVTAWHRYKSGIPYEKGGKPLFQFSYWLAHKWMGDPLARAHFYDIKGQYDYQEQDFRGTGRYHEVWRLTYWPFHLNWNPLVTRITKESH